MTDGPGYHNRQLVLATNISNLLYNLSPSKYDEIAPKIEYWIEYAINEQFTTIGDLAERVSSIAWSTFGSHSNISRFLKEFHDAPHRSKRVRSFIDELCIHVLRWFAVAAAEDLTLGLYGGLVPVGGGENFIRAASFVGHLIEYGLLSDELVRRHLVKPLTSHCYEKNNYTLASVYRSKAIYQLFIVAGNKLLQGLLEPEDVRACFEILDIYASTNHTARFDEVRLNELRKIHATWLRRKEEEQNNGTTTRVPTREVETPVAFVPQDLPGTYTGTPVAFVPQDLPPTHDVDVDAPSFTLRAIEPLLISRDMEHPSEDFLNISPTAVSSPTLSISTVSDLAPSELSENIEEDGDVVTHHEAFYFEDGNAEILCGHTLFRVHSTTIAFSSPKLREILSQSALLCAPMPEGCPRITVMDTAQDFAVLLKMIYTPGFPAWRKIPEFALFTSLLRMATKYGFSYIREQLVDSIKGAYPTKWGGPGTAKVLGEDVFGSPIPHPNAVLNLFLEQGVKFALPFAAYRAILGGFPSLTSDKPGTVLPRPALASTIYGMGVIRGRLAQCAHSIVCDMSLGECRDRTCAANVCSNLPQVRMEALNEIYNAMAKGVKGDVLSSRLPANVDTVCANCVRTPVETYRLWCEMTWGELPRIFGVGKSWEEV